MIKFYSTTACTHCNELKQQLIDKGVAFEFLDISDDNLRDEALALCRKTGNEELPIVVNGDKVFNRPSLEELL